MENPLKEIAQVVMQVAAGANADVQKAAIEKSIALYALNSGFHRHIDILLRYFAPNAGFRHPLATVDPGPNSRDSILGIYQLVFARRRKVFARHLIFDRWYRILSPQLPLEVDNVTYNETTQEIFLQIMQTLHIRWSPFLPVPSRFVELLNLPDKP